MRELMDERATPVGIATSLELDRIPLARGAYRNLSTRRVRHGYSARHRTESPIRPPSSRVLGALDSSGCGLGLEVLDDGGQAVADDFTSGRLVALEKDLHGFAVRATLHILDRFTRLLDGVRNGLDQFVVHVSV